MQVVLTFISLTGYFKNCKWYLHFFFMGIKKKSTKTRLIEAALDLFIERGVTETTTKAVAEKAEVNEVTLFRHFGNKNGLLLAAISDEAVFPHLGRIWLENMELEASFAQTLEDYSRISLENLHRLEKFVHSVIGEVTQYPPENRLALAQGLIQTNRYVARYFAKAMTKAELQSHFSPETLASLLHALMLGYFIIQSMGSGDVLWAGEEDFLTNLNILFLQGAVKSSSVTSEYPLREEKINVIADFPFYLVHSILQRGKKLGRQEYALAYVLFAAGLSGQEILNLERSHFISEPQQNLLQINWGAVRQVPLNQWIMGKRYGSANNNPLTQWLKSRKDEEFALFINEKKQPLSEKELEIMWRNLTEELVTPQGEAPTLEQTRQTWCVEMLMKGMELNNLSILSGMSIEELQPFAQRAKEKSAIEQANLLDRQT